MRLTYSDLLSQFLRNIGYTNTSGLNLTMVTNDFVLNMGQRYQLILAYLKSYVTQQPYTSSTVATQQYYAYPVGNLMNADAVITIGSVQYPLTTIYDQYTWDMLNALTIQPTAIPQFLFPRRDDFGIWPIPQDVYTITYNYFIRDRVLTVPDYASGTVVLTNGSTTLTGTGTTFTAAMVGRWFCVTDVNIPGQGYWFRVTGFSSTTVLTISRAWTFATTSAATYRIGESPEIPEEGHIMLCDGGTADFYAGLRSDSEKGVWFNNKFWTGDGGNADRDFGDNKISSGLIGLMNRYSGRDDKRVIQQQPSILPPPYKIWATTIS